MSSPALSSPTLCERLPGASPVGVDAIELADWPFLLEARLEEQFPDPRKANPKRADWNKVEELATDILARQSKDLRVAIYLLEAKIKLRGFAGLSDGLRTIRGLIGSFWDLGLHPVSPENDLSDRLRTLDWLNIKLPILLYQVPITRCGGNRDLSYERYVESRKTGYEADTISSEGDGGAQKRRERTDALARGEISAEMFDAVVAASKRSACERMLVEFQESVTELSLLEDSITQKALPVVATGDRDSQFSLSKSRTALQTIASVLDYVIEKKRQQEPAAIEPIGVLPKTTSAPGLIVASPGSANSSEVYQLQQRTELVSAAPGSWEQAERSITAGDIAAGLEEMTRLAALEHGRARFHRRLRLAEICLQIRHEKVALTVLEELNEQITALHLDRWESPELIARVWGNLRRCYERQKDSEEKVKSLYQQLCRLDPWQALRWEDASE